MTSGNTGTIRKRAKRRHVLLMWLERTHTPAVELARQIGISEPHMSRVLGKSRRLTMPVALRASLVTGLPVEKLLDRRAVEILESYVNRTMQPSEIGNDSVRFA